VVDGIVFTPAMQDVAWRRARPHADSLSGDSQEILMQVAPEGSPDGIVVADALRLLVPAVALKAETAELDHNPVRTERGHRIDAQGRAADVVRHPGKQIDHLPAIARHAGEGQDAILCSLIGIVFDLHRSDGAVPVGERRISTFEISLLLHAGGAVKIMHVVVVELAVGVVPELVITRYDGLVIMEDRERLGVELLAHDVESLADVCGQRLCIGIQRQPDEAAVRDLARELLKPNVFLPQPILISGFRAGNIHASSEAVELPSVKHARHVVGISRRFGHGQAARRLPQDQIAAMWAYVQESPNLVVRAAHDAGGYACHRNGPEIERFGNFRFVHGNEPDSYPDLLKLFFENALIAVDSAVDIRNRLAAIVGGLRHLRRHDNSPLRASTRNRNLRSPSLAPGLAAN